MWLEWHDEAQGEAKENSLLLEEEEEEEEEDAVKLEHATKEELVAKKEKSFQARWS